MKTLKKVWKVVQGHGSSQMQAQSSETTIARDVLKSGRATIQSPSEAVKKQAEMRVSKRFVPNSTMTTITTGSGKRYAARIINLSQTGIAIEPESRAVSPQDIKMVGSKPVRPGRRILHGVILLFEKPIDERICNAEIVL